MNITQMIMVEIVFVVLGGVHSAAKSEYFRRKILPYWSAQVKGLRDVHSDSAVYMKELQQRAKVSMCLGGGGGGGGGMGREGVWSRCICLGGVSEGCLNVQRVSEGYVESAQRVCGGRLNSVWRGVSGGVCLEGCVWRGVSGLWTRGCLEGFALGGWRRCV